MIHEGHLYETLVSVASDATDEADRIISRAVHAAAPELSESNTPVRLKWREAKEAFETILLSIESTLRPLCAQYDYRQFLHVSRLCSAVRALQREDKTYEDTRVRTLSADRWILRCAPRSLSRDYVIMAPNDYHLEPVPDSLCYDAAKLHVLAHFHQRVVVEGGRRFNFMRLVSARNELRAPKLRLHEEIRFGWDLPTELLGSLLVFNRREQHENGALGSWGMVEVETDDEFFALSSDPSPSFEETGNRFDPHPISLDAWLEYGRRFPVLFERDIGMPTEHFWAISRTLGYLGLQTAMAEGGRLQRWANLTATIPLRRDDLLGGRLEGLAADELEKLNPPGNTQDLEGSVGRFVRLASSSTGMPTLRAEAMSPEGESPDAATLRSTSYPYMIHGAEEHDYWVVDFLMTIPFILGVVNELGFSGSGSTTPSVHSDAFVRTSMFDVHLARKLTSIPGYEEAFTEHRSDPDLPNAKFSFNGRAHSREIDVPVRLGEVLIAVQTWTQVVNEKARAGERRAMEDRWKLAKEKLRDTDKKYTDYLLHNEEGREQMRSEGLRYILPVLCGPYAEPIVSLELEFWLHYPPSESPKTVEEEALPRILTPSELAAFLENTSEHQLKRICEHNDWVL